MNQLNAVDPDDLLLAFAEALRDVIRDVPESPDSDPTEVYVDLAARLVLRLSGSVAIIPKELFDQLSATTAVSPLLASATQAMLDALPECSIEFCSKPAVMDRSRCAKHGHYGTAGEHRFVEALNKLEQLGFRRKAAVIG